MSVLDSLIDTEVRDVFEVQDYIQILFSNNTILTIYNNYHYDCDNISNLIGTRLNHISESSTSVIFFLDNNKLSIGFKDDDYNGPEAMVMSSENKAPIIWN